ncbi:MAG: hypothetical protein NT062_03730, partial [Proteobacteria bacterium]|nr:hypothetical protein [Pseudomonadota bacterium]
VDLDDARVSKTPHQSGQFVVPARAPTPFSIPPPVVAAPVVAAPVVVAPPVVLAPPVVAAPPTASPTEPPSLEDTLVKLERAATRELATDVAMAFALGRWTTSLLFAVKEGVAIGHRGHGSLLTPDTILAITIPLATMSIVRSAHDARRIVTEVPAKAGVIQERLTRLLGHPHGPAAAPVVVGQRVACVLVVGDPRESENATEDITLDLDDLSVSLGLAYARILREASRS